MNTSNSQIPRCEIEEFIKVDTLRFLNRIPTAKQANKSFSDKLTEILPMYEHFGEEPAYSCS